MLSAADGDVVFDDAVRADPAAVADRGARADDAVRTEEHVAADAGIVVHHAGRVAGSPLGKAQILGVEILEQDGHADRDTAHREVAGAGIRAGRQRLGHLGIQNHDRRCVRAGLDQLTGAADEHQARRTGVLGGIAAAGGSLQVAAHEREHVGVLSLDGLGCNHCSKDPREEPDPSERQCDSARPSPGMSRTIAAPAALCRRRVRRKNGAGLAGCCAIPPRTAGTGRGRLRRASSRERIR